MNLKYANQTDFVIAGACVLTLAIFAINANFGSAILLYLNGIIVLSAFVYWAIRKDTAGTLKRGLIVGGIGGFFYTFVDKLFVELGAITYITYIKRGTGIEGGVQDIPIFGTPLSVVLLWIFCITIGIYLYQRLRSIFGKFYIPTLLTSASAFLATIILNNLGDRLWVWNFGLVDTRGFGSTPLFVPAAITFTFLLSPYIMGGQRITRRLRISDNPITAGLRCAVILSAAIYISYIIFSGYGRIGFGR